MEKTQSFRVTGMTCDGCAQRLKRVLEKAQGIKRAMVALSDDQAVVDFDQEQISSEAIEQVIRDAGFEAEARTDQ